jgi:hypothetical protein
MLHLQPVPATESAPEPYAEAVTRLASIRHALRLVDPFGGGPASDLNQDEAIAAAWPEADNARRRAFDTRSARLVGAPAAGVEALLNEQQKGLEPHEEASKALVEEIRRGLSDVARLILD